MKPSEVKRFNTFYERHQRSLKLQGKATKTIDAYSRAVRRVRDYGFLHSNAKKLLSLVLLILHVVMKGTKPRPRPVFKCPFCQTPMIIMGFRRRFLWETG